MARSYSLPGSVATPNSATLPAASLISAANIRPKIYDILVGSTGAPADNAGRFSIQRCSTPGTPGSSPTPSPIDPGDPASIATAGLAVFTVGPTLGVTLLQWGQNQRATFRWVAAPGKELVAPAVASNGLALMNPAVNAAFTMEFSIEFEE